MELKLIERKSPFAEKAGSFGLNIGESEDRYGAHSIQEFPSIGERGRLNFTHADAQGFMDWYGNWNKGNFWFTDSGVQVWGYEESYDNWLDTYGMDSVVVFTIPAMVVWTEMACFMHRWAVTGITGLTQFPVIW